ncbi:MAG: magnesium transporter [Oscillospiraceae bacterium]
MAKRNKEVRLGVLAGQRNYHALRGALQEMNAVDVAQFIEDLPEEQATVVFRTLAKEQAMEVFAELDAEAQQEIISAISDREIGLLLEDLAVDDAVDMLEEMPAALVKRVLQTTTPATRALLNQFLRYPENSAGSIMTAEFTDLHPSMTVEEAINRIRSVGHDRETIYTCYVIDSTRHLLGVVSVKDLLLAPDGQSVEDLMEEDIFSVITSDDQETATNLMTRYSLISLPVVDNEYRLVGIVTVDDAVDVIQEETTEDFEKMAGMAPSEKPYLKTGVFSLSRNRLTWLLVLMISAMLTSTILDGFTAVFAAIPLLVTFIPLLTDAGGDAGSQSSTLVIRGMALGEISLHNIGSVIWKEVRVSILVGIPLAAVNMVRMMLSYPGEWGVGLVVSLAMLFTIVLANAIGGALPMLAKAIKLDPALMAAPLISTLVDSCSLVIYFGIAILLLNL